jgi:hypothetical protein
MKDYRFCFLLFLMFSCHIIIGADYNKIDEKQKMEFGKGLPKSKRPRYEGLSSMEKKLEFSIL